MCVAVTGLTNVSVVFIAFYSKGYKDIETNTLIHREMGSLFHVFMEIPIASMSDSENDHQDIYIHPFFVIHFKDHRLLYHQAPGTRH